jgi:hypothetical protein
VPLFLLLSITLRSFALARSGRTFLPETRSAFWKLSTGNQRSQKY